MGKILFVTDLYFKAKGRNYYEEDLFLTSQLRKDFELIICHPEDTEAFEENVDLIIFRNAGPISNYEEKYRNFRNRIDIKNLKSYNSFDGKADMNGKEYLIELSRKNFPVIPTIDNIEKIYEIPESQTYIMKPKNGA